MRLKLTEAKVRLLEHDPEGGRLTRYWDSEARRLMVEVTPNGAKTYHAEVPLRGAGRVRVRLGKCADLTLEDARKKARKAASLAEEGTDPREAWKVRRGQTVAEYWQVYRKSAALDWKPSTLANHDHVWKTVIGTDPIAKRPLDGIRPSDLTRWKHDNEYRPIRWNHAFRLLRALINHAIREEVIESARNPCSKAKPYKEQPRQRVLSPEEVERLLAAIAEEERLGMTEDPETGEKRRRRAVERAGEAVKGKRGGQGLKELESRGISPHAAALFRILLFTGARLSEIKDARWEWIDLEAGFVRLPDSKTGAKTIRLTRPAVEIIRELATIRSCDFLIEGDREGKPLVCAQRSWQRVRKRAGLDSLRIHDLRHHFATTAVEGGASLYLTGKVLGHRQSRTTQRYANPVEQAVATVADETAERIAAMAPKARVLEVAE